MKKWMVMAAFILGVAQVTGSAEFEDPELTKVFSEQPKRSIKNWLSRKKIPSPASEQEIVFWQAPDEDDVSRETSMRSSVAPTPVSFVSERSATSFIAPQPIKMKKPKKSWSEIIKREPAIKWMTQQQMADFEAQEKQRTEDAEWTLLKQAAVYEYQNPRLQRKNAYRKNSLPNLRKNSIYMVPDRGRSHSASPEVPVQPGMVGRLVDDFEELFGFDE